MTSIQPSIQELVTTLSDVANAEPADRFPVDRVVANNPGLYSWWADDEARAELSKAFGILLPSLIYAGQAGATSTQSKTERAATLLSRIGGNHLKGNIGSSTFRRTLTAVLLEPLDLCVNPSGRLDTDSNGRLSAWMRQHLRLAIAPYPDRGTLAAVEHAVLAALDPPLNLMGMVRTPVRNRLSELRAALSTPSDHQKQAEVRLAERPAGALASGSHEDALTLHEAMVKALDQQGWTTFPELATRIEMLDLYRKRDGQSASPGQLRLRATKSGGRYAHLFEVEGNRIRAASS